MLSFKNNNFLVLGSESPHLYSKPVLFHGFLHGLYDRGSIIGKARDFSSPAIQTGFEAKSASYQMCTVRVLNKDSCPNVRLILHFHHVPKSKCKELFF
jgi:hypothetical protein